MARDLTHFIINSLQD
ncbi:MULTISPECIES: two-component system connector SafA [Enterobacteriaceae]|nr:two-component system connector SafA [Shigella sonnei]EJY1241965.1 two-component system connector SafA [Escherichia coli]